MDHSKQQVQPQLIVRFSFVFFLLCIVFSSCKNDPKAAANTEQPPGSAPINAIVVPSSLVKPELMLYAISVDNPLLHDQPTMRGSATLGKFKLGDIVKGSGERSEKQEETTLRDIPYRDYFYKVQGIAADSKLGWVFGGAIIQIYAGTNANAPDLVQVQALASHLNSLPVSDIKSGKKAWDYVSTNFSNANGALADAVYVLLDAFTNRMEVEGEMFRATDKVDWKPADHEAISKRTFDMNKTPLTQSLAENGFRLETAEGSVFPITDWQKMYDFFAPRGTAVMKAYLDTKLSESKDMASEDGGLIIPVMTLADRAAFWEKFNQENPYFMFAEPRLLNQVWMRNAVLCGMDNTPIHDTETKKINPDYRAAWEAIQKKYPGSQLAAKAKEISSLCAADNWMYTEKIFDWMIKLQEENF